MVTTQKTLKTRTFKANSLDTALTQCLQKGYRALFMPELVDHRINADAQDPVWDQWFSTPSLRATGRTRSGKAVVLYVHTDNYFSNPEHLKNARTHADLCVNGAGILPQEEFDNYAQMGFDRVVNAQGDPLVYVVDPTVLKNAPSRVIPVRNALEHPQVIPFLGGEERAKAYLARHQDVFGPEIGVWYIDDLGEQPVARVLWLGDLDGVSLDGDFILYDSACFFGVRAPQGAKTAGASLSFLEQILHASRPFVADAARTGYEAAIKKLYKKLYNKANTP